MTEMCNRVVVVWKSRLIRQGMTNWRWPQSRPCDDFGFWWWLLSGWWLSGIEKTWWLSSERPWVWSFLVDCADDNDDHDCDGNYHDYDRVAKTCRPCRPVGANFFKLVLIFGQSMQTTVPLPNAHITYTIAHWANITVNCTMVPLAMCF